MTGPRYSKPDTGTVAERKISPIKSGSFDDAPLRGYDLSLEMGPTSHTTVTVPTSRSENSPTYPAASHPRTRGSNRWDLNKINFKKNL
ncbi:hypothetical protein AVEN_225717-1 [Araneus ventricosus]|uniref:Uncharacterized protein n=1 Tax=Araneus ventricosus TaxID=182803 RepID=A0A4Y2RMA7_ARAVE|nr:hypothetical protein AVEN_225717-1 [Araneus ventricosus]